MSNCTFVRAWVGPCGSPMPCTTHQDTVCSSCRQPATHECEETIGPMVCGAHLCNDCEHTICTNGCNSGAPLPNAMKEHCKKTDQQVKPWYTQ